MVNRVHEGLRVTLAKSYSDMSGKKEKPALAICRARKMELVLTDRTIHLCVIRALSVVFVVVDEKWCLQFLTREIWILTSLCLSESPN